MKKVFWDNPYQTSLETRVTIVNGNQILFEETIAYSFSGGQENDTAYVNGLLVVNSHVEGPKIFYTLPQNHGLTVGDTVTMTIDWPRRYKLMRLHFAAELVLELVTQRYHLEKVGAHISASKARIDFVYPQHISELFDTILSEYNTIIASDREIIVGFSDIENQRRYWKIDGFAQVPCGGTHVKSTKEVGYVNLKRSRSAKGIERIEITLTDPL